MNSKEALADIRDYHNETVIDNYCTYTENMFEKELDTIEKDLDRLEEYSKIEKELGIDLKVYHKLMNMLYCGEPNILYVKDKDMIIQVSILEIDYCKKKIIFYEDISDVDGYIYNFIQYGKTFALTKEELEK